MRRPLLALSLLAAAPSAQIQGVTVFDGWSTPSVLRTDDGRYATAIHVHLLPDGRVLCVGSARTTPDSTQKFDGKLAFTLALPPLGEALPAETQVDELLMPVDYDLFNKDGVIVDDTLFCSGHTAMADGSFFSVGGTRGFFEVATGETITTGLGYATRYGDEHWERVPEDMIGTGGTGSPLRWYPTPVRLPDERILIVGGFELLQPTPTFNLSAEIYHPRSETWNLHSAHYQVPPFIFSTDYTHAFVLPEPLGAFDVLTFGQAGVPVQLDVDGDGWLGSKWLKLPKPRPGSNIADQPNWGASTALLPLRGPQAPSEYTDGTVMVAGGGSMGSSHQHSVDFYDARKGQWLERIETGVPRHHPNTVLLPDGRVLIVGGHGPQYATSSQATRTQYVDAQQDLQLQAGAADAGVLRGYHAVAALLPDGRVFLAGGKGDPELEQKDEQTTFQLYYPSYLFAPRPRIVEAPAEIGFGEHFELTTRGAQPERFALMGVPSMTHSFDTNQRHIELELAGSVPGQGQSWRSRLLAPANGRIAPPGLYMLFALDAARTPSEAVFVQLD